MTPFDLLASGDWLGAIITGYTDVIGSWFFVIIAFAIIAAVQFKTESAESTSIVMLLLGAVGLTTNYLTAVNTTGNFNMVWIWGFMTAMGLALPFFKFFARRE